MPKMPPPAGHGALAPTFDLFDLGVRIMRQNFRRLHPGATEDEIDRRLGEWVQHRPGAEGSDAVGRSVDPHARLTSGIESEIVRDAESVEVLPGLPTRVARTGHLIALKLLSRDDVKRPQDIVDLRALLKGASPEEIARAGEAAEAIIARGYHRGRDLSADPDTWHG